MLKCAPQLREDQREWAVVVHSIIDSSVAANRWLLMLLSKDKPEEEGSLGEEVIESFLVWCDQVQHRPEYQRVWNKMILLKSTWNCGRTFLSAA